MSHESLTVRRATAHDAGTLRRLAGLDSRRPLHGPAVIAERDDVAIAAVALTSGDVAADPFARTAEAVTALRLRRDQLLHQGSEVGPARLLLVRRVNVTPAGA
jgi:hypothetical protein